MALIKCKECGKEISSKADVCPHCGKKISHINFSYLIAWLVLIFIFYKIHSCFNNFFSFEENPKTTSTSQNVQTYSFLDGNWDDWINITPQIVEHMIKNGSDVNAKGHNGTSVLMKASSRSKLEVVDVLIKYGADVNARDDNGWTPVQYAAAINQDPRVIETLIQHGARINTKDNNGQTSLMVAALNNKNPQIIKTLIEHGADINAQTQSGMTALMHVVLASILPKNRNIEVMKILLQHGADINAKTVDGATAILLTKDPEIIEILKENGAKN